MEFSKEQIEKAKNCNTIDELKDLAKAEGIELTEEEANEYFTATHSGELNDDDLSAVAGGKGTWVPVKTIVCKVKCPFCGSIFPFKYISYQNSRTKYFRTEDIPSTCTCGATLHFYDTTNNLEFMKNGESKIVYPIWK